MRNVILFILLFTSACVAAQSPVIPDTSFNGTGRNVFSVGANLNFGDNVAVQPDGKILMTGASMNLGGMVRLGVCRFNENGSFDNTFGASGISLIDLGGQPSQGGFEPEMVIQPDGKIVVCGFGWNGIDEDMFICRLLPGGSLDPAFGNDGRIFLSMLSIGMPDAAYTITSDASGNIYACGSTRTGATPYTNDLSLVKLTPAGQPDPTFSEDGKMLLDLSGSWDFGYGIAITDAGKIIITGYTQYPTDFFAIRLLSDGSYDNTFGTGGKTTIDIFGTNSMDKSWGMTVTADGKIVLAGEAYSTSGNSMDAAVVRLTAGGALDNTFSGNGIATFHVSPVSTVMRNVIEQPDGKLLLSGNATINGNEDFAVIRLNPDGTLDQSFNLTGTYTIDVSGEQKKDIGYGLALQTDGKILVSGNTSFSEFFNEKYSIVRLTTDNPGVHVDEFMADQFLSIYPNPAESQITVKMRDNSGDRCLLWLVDATGRRIRELPVARGSRLIESMDVSDLERGLYSMLYVNEGKIVANYKFMKN